jgi:UDP-N-acetylglucosamine:LPS N-acetylglucosamine transferase
MTEMPLRKKRILAIASGGGHWVQLNRLSPAWKNLDVIFASTMPGTEQSLRTHADQPAVHYVPLPEANQWQKFRLLLLVWKILVLLLRTRPDFVITTGAAHGYFAIRIGKLLGAKTIWIDSIANAEEMSGSGRMVKAYADVWLTQWPHIANSDDGPRFEGAVL